MKIRELTESSGYDYDEFLQFLKNSNLHYESTLQGRIIDDYNIDEYKRKYEEYLKNKNSIIITTAPSLENYKIKQYCGLVVGYGFYHVSYAGQEIAQYFGSASGNRANDLGTISANHKRAMQNAYIQLKENALLSGANAIISVTPNSVSSGGVTCITIMGTAVIIEKAGASNGSTFYTSFSDYTKNSIDPSPSNSSEISIDKYVCLGCGKCVDKCPELFQMDVDGKAKAIAKMNDNTQVRGHLAIDNCPVGAITLDYWDKAIADLTAP